MKKPINYLVVIILLFALNAQAQSITQIFEKIDKVSYAKSSKAAILQTVIDPAGEKREFKIVSYSLDGSEKGLSQYVFPQQVNGMKILSLNDGNDIWVFFPKTGRVRKIASSARKNRVQGSDFSYDDLAQGKISKQFTGKILGEEVVDGIKCYKLLLTPTQYGPTSYSKIISWVDKNRFIMIQNDYYDTDNNLWKRLFLQDYRNVNGHLMPYKMTMMNIQDGGRTIMEIKTTQVDININNELFSPDNLSQ